VSRVPYPGSRYLLPATRYPATAAATRAVPSPFPPAIACSTAPPRIRTLTSDDTPGSCIVTPYTASAASVRRHQILRCAQDDNAPA